VMAVKRGTKRLSARAERAESLSQPSHRLAGRHRTQRPAPDTWRTLTCGTRTPALWLDALH
jgi:hypothetical protein